MRFGPWTVLLCLLSFFEVDAATFGTVVVIGGHASDLALDESRGKLYIANFAGRRIDVMSTATNTLLTPIPMTQAGESGSLAISPDNHYLVVSNYDTCGGCSFLTGSGSPFLTVIDLNSGKPINPPSAVPGQPTGTTGAANLPLVVAFGKDKSAAGAQALVVTTTGLYLFNPATRNFQPLPPPALTSEPLPVPFGTYPPEIIEASAGLSGDGETIFVLAQGVAPNQVVIRYNIPSGSLEFGGIVSTPPLGPREIAVDLHGLDILAGWSLYDTSYKTSATATPQYVLLAQFPYPTGSLNIGGLAYDWMRNRIYAEIPSSNGAGPPVLHIADTDNLTIRERINLQENLAGRSIFSSDMNTLYAISDSGVTVFPFGSFASAHRVATQEEQLLFLANSCANGLITQTLHVYDLGGGQTDFSLSVPAGTNGITISPSSGTTPASVTIQVDPTAFQTQNGTTSIPLTIQSNGSIGIPNTVNLLINTKQPNQRGIIHGLPGKIVDILADNPRGRFYALRQDRNMVLVLDATTFNEIPAPNMRTGNTPTQMTLTRDNRYLIVGNDNSQIASVFDLDSLALTPFPFIVFPPGQYPHGVAVSNSSMLGVARNVTPLAPGLIDTVNFANRTATTPSSLGIYIDDVPPDTIMIGSPSGGSIFTPMSNGTVLLFDDSYQAFEASRQDLSALAGAYSAISDSLFMAGGNLFNRSMVEDGTIAQTTSDSSIYVSGNNALVINAPAAAAPGVAQRETVSTPAPLHPIPTIEAPVTKTILTTPPIGQIGETIPTFLRTMATLGDGATVYLSISGFTELPANFDQPVAFPTISSVVNMADGGQVAPGSLIVIDGSGLAANSASAMGLPLPTSLAGTCAVVNNIPVPLIRVSSTVIDAQMPYEVTGTGTLVVTSPGGQSGPFNINVPANAPAVFRTGQAGSLTGLPLIYRTANNQLVDFSNPIHPDDTLVIIATGLGQTSPSAVDGAAATSHPLESALVTPSISIGNVSLGVPFAGLIPGEVGMYQINAVVPHEISAAAQVPLIIQQGGVSTSFNVRVVNP